MSVLLSNDFYYDGKQLDGDSKYFLLCYDI